MGTRLTSADRRTFLVAATVAALSLLVCLKYFRSSFPEASLDLRVDRAQSEAIARSFLAARGISLDGYRHTAVFSYDDDSKLFLERTLGLDRMNRLTAGPVHLWRWSHRWFRPQQEEEFSVDVSPTGDVVDFHHALPEAAPGQNPDLAAARSQAERFLVDTMHRDLAGLEFLESGTRKRPARTDYTFTWKQKDVDLRDGSLRITVVTHGDEVASYSEYVHVPEQWQRDYEKLRSRNDTAQTIDEVFFYLLSAAMLVMLVVRVRHRALPVRTAAAFGCVAAALSFLSQVNDFPLAKSGYSTTESYASFVANYFGGSAVSALGVAAFIFFLVATAEPEYREAFPTRIPLRRYCTWSGLRTRSFLIANVVGLTLAFFFFGYQTLFYFCANHLGAWAPSDIPFTNQLNTSVPWVTVLFSGFFPAVSEEMQFRAFAIPFLRRWLRSLPLAIVLAAFNWGFLHSAYPNQPFFIRGLEVGVGGVIIGFVMMRYGILATLIWHYSVDALYSAFLLLRSPNHYLFLSGAITGGVMLLPLAAACISYLRAGSFVDEQTLLDAAPAAVPAEVPPGPPAEAPQPAYAALSRRRTAVGAALIVVFAAISFIPVYRFGQGVKLRMTVSQAEHAADACLRSRGLDPSSYHRVVTFSRNLGGSSLNYLFEQAGVRRADQIYRRATQLAAFEVRYFRPLQVQEHQVLFDAVTGQFIDYRLRLDENAPGATLEAAKARSLAEQTLAQRGFQLSTLELQDSHSEKRKAREDFTFVWQAKPGDFRNVGEEKYRATVNIAGDQVTGVSDYFKVPEEWTRRHFQRGLVNSILGLAAALLGIVLFVRAIILFVAQLRAGQIAWRAAAPVAAILAGLSLLSDLNGLPYAEQGYSTSISLSTFWVQMATGTVLSNLSIALGAWLLLAIAFGLYPEAKSLWKRSAARPWRRDAAFSLVLVITGAAALQKFNLALSLRWPALFPPALDFIPSGMNSVSPALAALCSAIPSAVSGAAALGIVVAILRSGWTRRAWWIWLLLVLWLVALGPAGAHSVGEYFAVWAVKLLTSAAGLALAVLWLRSNPLAYLVALFSLGIIGPAVSLLSQGSALYLWNGVALAVAAGAALAWLLVPGRAAAAHDLQASASAG